MVRANSSGKVTGEHLFGNLPGLYEDGFAQLATLDHDNDGKLEADELKDLAIWTDANSNAVIDAGELETLKQYGVVSLPVNHYKYMARAQRDSGKSILMEDVWLKAAFISASK